MKSFKIGSYVVKYHHFETKSNYNISISVFKNKSLLTGTIGKSDDKEYVLNTAIDLISNHNNRKELIF